MKKVYFLVMLMCMSFIALSQPVNLFSAGAGGSFITGNSTATVRTDGNIVSTAATQRGYAVIDLGLLPAAAVITSVTVNFNKSAYGGTPGAGGWAIRGFVGDLSLVATPATLFADMGAAAVLTNATWGFGTGNVTLASNAALINFVQTNLGTKVSIVWTGGNTRIYTITGETGPLATTGAHAPYLTVNYTIPPPCPAPTGVSATAVPNPACVGANLSLTGAATGATDYTWAGPGGYAATGLTQSPVVTPTSGGIYTFTATNNCVGGTPTSASATTVGISVLASPAPIAGGLAICTGGTTVLSDATTGGFWTTGSPGVATVVGGTVTGLAAGTATISYTTPVTGCSATAVVTVSAPTGPISGASAVCIGNSTTLTDASPGGVWSSGAPLVATVDPTGLVTGLSIGTATITYTVTGSACPPATFNITVAGLPVAITGPTSVCTGDSVTLSDFTTGGTWASTAPGVATIDSNTGVVTGVTVGTTNITYTISATGCFATASMSVNLSPSPITGPHSVCLGSTIALADASAPGAWSSNNPVVAGVDGVGNVSGASIGVATITFTTGPTTLCPATYSVTVNPIPVAIFGPTAVCTGSSVTLGDGTAGGTWSSSDTTIATIDSNLGVATGIAAGTVTITYTVAGCFATANLLVNLAPAAIAGPTVVCQFSTITLTDGTAGDVWSSTNTTIATVDAGGIVTGVLPGVDTILYTDPASACFASYVITVNLAPTAIVGSALICTGSSITYTDPVAGGTWSSSNTAAATIDSVLGTATGVAAGTTTISYTITAGGCFVTLDITDNDPPTAIGGPTVVCQNSTITLTDATAGDTWSSSDDAIATVDPTGIVTGVAGGAVTISYTDPATTCFAVYPITVNPQPSAITGVALLCTGSSVTFTDADPGGTWSSSATGVATVDSTLGIVTGVAIGTATITYTFSATSCAVTFDVTDNDPPAAIGGPTVVCQNSTITLTDATAGDTWSSSDDAIATVDATGIVTGVVGGAVTISYTDPATTCFATYPITVNPQPSAITGPALICTGNSYAYTDADAGGTWSSTVTTVATIDSTLGTLDALLAGTTTISYTFSATGCAITLDVTDNDPPGTITGTPDSLICTGSSLTLIPDPASPGGFWTSSLPGVVSVDALLGIITGNSAGTAIITYTQPATTCFAVIPITDVDPPGPITGFTNQVCEGGTIVLSETVSGGIWTSTATAIATVGSTGLVTIVSGVLAGTTTIEYTITGCPAADFPVTVNPTPQPIVGADTVCVASSTTLTDPTAGGTWSSSDNGIATVDLTLGIVTGVTAGVVDITYTLPAGCFVTMSFTVNPLPDNIGTTTIFVVCVGSTITLTDATAGGKWSSDNTAIATVDSMTGVVTGMGAGTVDIIFTLPTSCNVSATITVNPLPAAIGGPDVVCEDATITVTNTTPGGTWSSGDDGIATVDFLSGVVTGVTAGVVNITYAITTGCISTLTITVNPIPAAIFGLSQVCVGSNITLTDASVGGTWGSSNPVVATVDAGGIVYGAASGTTDVTYKFVTTGCFVTSTVTVNPLPAVITGGASVCQDGTLTLADATPGGTWSSSNTARATVDLLTGVVYGVTTGGVNIIYTLPTGCSISLAVTVLAAPSALLTISGPTTFCKGGNVLLSAPVGIGLTYQWYNGAVAIVGSTSATFSAVADGSYTVIVTNASGCSTTSVVVPVTAEIIPVIPYLGPDTFCYGNHMILTATTGGAVGIFTYQWLVNGTLIPGAVSATFAATGSGNYQVIVNTNGPSGVCTDTSGILNILVHPVPTPLITFDGTTFSSVNPYVAYQWFLNMVSIAGATAGTYVPVINGSYRLLVVDTNGCDAYSNAIALTAVGVKTVDKAAIKIFPNPTSNILHIESPVKLRAEISGVEGKILMTQDDAKDMDISHLADGLYIIMLYDESGEKIITEKLIKE